MAFETVSTLLEPLLSIAIEEIQEEVRLLVGVEEEVEKLKSNLEAIQAVLLDAEEIQLKDVAARLWLGRLKHISYDVEDVLDKWNTAIMKLQLQVKGDNQHAVVPRKKVHFLFRCHCLCTKEVALRHNVAHTIKEVNGNLVDIAKQKDMFNLNVVRRTESTYQRVQRISLIDESEIYGRDDIKHTLLNKLLCETRDEKKGPHILSLLGMGGIGKTTLAQVAYNNVKNKFDKAIWLCVSDPFDEFRNAKAIIAGLEVPKTPDSGELETLTQCIHETVTNNKILLVLDDVWTEDYQKWQPFEGCLKRVAHESRILITTRKREVADMMKSSDIITVKKLPEQYCWELFKRTVGKSDEECRKLEDIGREIVAKCKGLPLALKTIGSLLRYKENRREWRQILNSEMWELKEFEKDIFHPLLLSYNDLPSIVKLCFMYCSIIFPKDCEINKDQLIKLWMAQGYLGLDQNIEMEEVGERYFNILATRSFFQEFKKDADNKIIYCKMHDIVHDFAQFLNLNECFTKEISTVGSSQQKTVRHLMLTISTQNFPAFISDCKKLRSILFESAYSHSDAMVLQNLFDKFICLRALAIKTEPSLTEIPEKIENLMHLRYLSLSSHKFENLPESLCELYNLQTLDLTSCDKLKELPRGIGRLVNLRHLLNSGTPSLSYLPVGIQVLTCLRTLSEFVVSGDGHDGIACTLESLKNLNHLSGDFKIRGLGNVSNVNKLKPLELHKKEKLCSLTLDFTVDGEGKSLNEEDEVVLLEYLQPPPDLDTLKMINYRGAIVTPSWIGSLTVLRKFILEGCTNCKHLSPLGKLPFLEILEIYTMNGEKRVGNEFWGIKGDDTSTQAVFFPNLKHLEMWWINEWEEWNYEITRNQETKIIIMPRIVSLKIGRMDRLKALPEVLLQSTTLKKLDIFFCSNLANRYHKETGEDWSKISHIPDIKMNEISMQEADD